MEKIYQDRLAEILGVKVRTLRQWRTSDYQSLPLYLPAHRDNPADPSYYYMDEVMAWAERNPRYLDRLLSEGIENQLPPITPANVAEWWSQLHTQEAQQCSP